MKLDAALFKSAVEIMDDESANDVIKKAAFCPGQEEPFYILDVGDIVNKIKLWHLKLPRVEPFYAVKCNDNETVLETLGLLGIGFDCASKGEMKKVLSLGISPSQIVYANPCKPASHIKHAASYGIDHMTFDNEAELHKIKALYPSAKLLIRIRCDAKIAQCPLGIKFGVLLEDVGPLLTVAKNLDLDIVGVAFHVGSGCREPEVFGRAIRDSRKVFDDLNKLGFCPYILDIGGGFPGHRGSSMDQLADVINTALDFYFPVGCRVKIIAEPGRYVVASAFTLLTSVIAKRPVLGSNGEALSTMYYINDGVYGSFNCVLYDHQEVTPRALVDTSSGSELCSVWGPTCDGLDQVTEESFLPQLELGDWLAWDNMGAYTIAAAGTFNGFPVARVRPVIPRHSWIYLEELKLSRDAQREDNCHLSSLNVSSHGDAVCCASSGFGEFTFLDVADL